MGGRGRTNIWRGRLKETRLAVPALHARVYRRAISIASRNRLGFALLHSVRSFCLVLANKDQPWIAHDNEKDDPRPRHSPVILRLRLLSPPQSLRYPPASSSSPTEPEKVIPRQRQQKASARLTIPVVGLPPRWAVVLKQQTAVVVVWALALSVVAMV